MEPVFKEYQQDQLYLLPPSLEELIPSSHLVRVVNDTVEKMDLKVLLDSYLGGGTSSYHPKMLLKILIYGYVTKTYSSRRMSKSIRENINFMWLSGNNRPDFRTINNFRSSRLKDFIDTVFGSTLELLIEAKLVKIEDYFQDGTTLEADANKHSYVWKKNVERYKGKLQNRIKDLIKKIDEINEAEDKEYGERDLEEMGEESTITSEKIKQKVDEINRKMKEITDKTKAKQTESLSKKLNKEYLPKLQKYENQQKILGKRNSYSRTDPDATFIRLKGNGFGNKELKPAYNIQIGTENQFIVGYSVHQNASDSVTMISHLEKLKGILGKVLPSSQRKLPLNIITDAGYGSEENYQYLESEKMQGYVKYNMFDLEKTKKYKENKFRTENLQYDDQKDEYICPNNKVLRYIKTVTSKSATGYQSEKRLYQCENCDGCELRSLCHKSKDNRIIQQSQTLNNYRAKARSLLETDIGKQFSKKRSIEVESVFGDIKRNRSFERFNLRGTEKVNSELGLVSIAHNMIKVWRTKINEGLMKKLVVAN
jgi:transposase